MTSTRYLQIKWTTSRARDTYGYNVVTLTDTETGKKYRANGGGYDMTGTVFGEWLQDVHQDKLQTIAHRAHQTLTQNDGGPWDRLTSNDRDSLYGMTFNSTTGAVRVDGGCGLDSMRRIAEAAGLTTRALISRKGNVDGFIVTESES